MEGLLVHLSHSKLFDLVTLRFSFLVFTVLILWLFSSCGACEVFKCGNYVYGYPFGLKNSGCGDPALQLHCDYQEHKPLININGHQYYIWYPFEYFMPTNNLDNESNHDLLLLYANLKGDNCNPVWSNYSAQLWSSPQFHFRGEYENLTLLHLCPPDTIRGLSPLPCNHKWYYGWDLNSGSVSKCESRVVLPVQKSETLSIEEQIQIQIEWNVSENCTKCYSNGGRCAYDNRSIQFCCECSAEFCANKCFHVKSVANGFNTKIVIFRSLAIGTGALLVIAVLLVIVCQTRLLDSCSQKHHPSNVEKFLDEFVHEMPARYSYSHLNDITQNFRHKLGEGGFGVVYKGKLQSGILVAVKMLDQSRQSETQFMNEVATIGRIHHINLIRLLGYCFEEFRSALVYEYMVNGSLDMFILPTAKEGKNTLTWQQLYSIALGTARGIAYLHDECHSRIIHFDIKPHNILLNEEFTAKVADFGLAKLSGRQDDHVSMTITRGTPGYIAPELWSTNLGPVTEKSDVYGFGMMLLQMVGGRQKIDVGVSCSSQFYFPKWVFKMIESEELRMRLRERDAGELRVADEEMASRLTKVGVWCIQYNSRDRPSMMRVVQMLEGDGDDVTNPPIPFDVHQQVPLQPLGEVTLLCSSFVLPSIN